MMQSHVEMQQLLPRYNKAVYKQSLSRLPECTACVRARVLECKQHFRRAFINSSAPASIHGSQPSPFIVRSIKTLTILLSTVKFDDCMGNEEVAFQSSDPIFSVQADGSVFARVGGASLDEPVQFKVTAHGPHTHVWQTVVRVALSDPPSSQQTGKEVSYRPQQRGKTQTSHSDFNIHRARVASF